MKRQKKNNLLNRRKRVRRNARSSAPTYVGETIPIDLIIEILSRLPAKSIAVFRCVSKQWASLLERPYFRELFLTSSLSRPCSLFTLRIGNKWHFFSFPQPRDLGENLSVVATDYQYHMSYCEDRYIEICQSVNGFIHMNNIGVLRGTTNTVDVIYNPSTGQHITLPKVSAKRAKGYVLRSFFGHDPIGKQFKVLCIPMSYYKHTKPQVLTLGNGGLSWRKIECLFTHYPKGEVNGICINGALYYIAYMENSYNRIVCFDVRSEKFSFIEILNANLLTLINYKGKLGVILRFEYGGLELWVKDDAKKVQWSKHIFVLENPVLEGIIKSIWATDTGEIAWVSSRWTNPLCVFYYNLERQSVRTVEIKGMEDKLLMGRDHQESVFTITNHVENLMFL